MDAQVGRNSARAPHRQPHRRNPHETSGHLLEHGRSRLRAERASERRDRCPAHRPAQHPRRGSAGRSRGAGRRVRPRLRGGLPDRNRGRSIRIVRRGDRAPGPGIPGHRHLDPRSGGGTRSGRPRSRTGGGSRSACRCRAAGRRPTPALGRRPVVSEPLVARRPVAAAPSWRSPGSRFRRRCQAWLGPAGWWPLSAPGPACCGAPSSAITVRTASRT